MIALAALGGSKVSHRVMDQLPRLPLAATPWWRQPRCWIAVCLAVGLGLRAYHYLREPSMWHDEAYQMLNVLERGYDTAFSGQDFAEAAPPLFFVAEKAAADVLGDSLYALRLLPFFASCLTLILLAVVAWRLLPTAAAPWAVFCCALSDRLLWHACEAKPYSFDVLAAVVLIALVGLTTHWSLARRLLVLTVLAPLIIWASFPGCFLYGGVLVALVWPVLSSRSPRVMLTYALLAVVVFGAFAVLALGPVRAQRNDAMDSCWLHYFPPVNDPARLAWWLIDSTLEIGRYALRPAGAVLILFVAFGSIMWWRQRRFELLALLLVPWALALVASFLRSYPYGGARVLAYTTPAVFLLAAAGLAHTLAWLGERSRAAMIILAALFVLVPVARAATKAAAPWQRADIAGAVAHIRSHWQPGDIVVHNSTVAYYYFRDARDRQLHLQDGATLKDRFRDEPQARLWVMLVAPELQQRDELLRAALLKQGHVVERREFELTDVHLVVRPKSRRQLASQ
jgi:hypothetical protein